MEQKFKVLLTDRYDPQWAAVFVVRAENEKKAVDFVKRSLNPRYVFRKIYNVERFQRNDAQPDADESIF